MGADDYTRPAGRRMMTADLRAQYPRDTEDQAVLRLLTRNAPLGPPELPDPVALRSRARRPEAAPRRRPVRTGSPAAFWSE